VECRQAFKVVGVKDEEAEDIWRTLGGILHLQNIVFSEKGEGSELGADAKKSLETCCNLWQVDMPTFHTELLQSTFTIKGNTTTKLHSPRFAKDGLDALCKALYDNLFQWLVETINKPKDSEGSTAMWIGLLDIFGSECFVVNSFEQLCINLANETLQGHYNDYIFRRDIEEMRGEGIDVRSIPYPDNSPCLKMVTGKGGIFSMLDEQCIITSRMIQLCPCFLLTYTFC
jgi:myosin heavy subunit